MSNNLQIIPSFSESKSASKPYQGTLLTQNLYDLFIEYLKSNRNRAPEAKLLTDLIETFQDGAKHDRRALQCKFKSWSRRMELRTHNGKSYLVLCQTDKIIIPKESFEIIIRKLHNGENGVHRDVDEVVEEIKKVYTWGRRDFGMDWDIVANALAKCSNPSCLLKLKQRFTPRPLAGTLPPPATSPSSSAASTPVPAAKRFKKNPDNGIDQSTPTPPNPSQQHLQSPRQTAKNNGKSSAAVWYLSRQAMMGLAACSQVKYNYVPKLLPKPTPSSGGKAAAPGPMTAEELARWKILMRNASAAAQRLLMSSPKGHSLLISPGRSHVGVKLGETHQSPCSSGQDKKKAYPPPKIENNSRRPEKDLDQLYETLLKTISSTKRNLMPTLIGLRRSKQYDLFRTQLDLCLGLVKEMKHKVSVIVTERKSHSAETPTNDK